MASKHGVIGLLRSSQIAAARYNVRVNGVAPFFTPTHITSSYSERWRASGLPANSVEDVALAILQTSLDPLMRGRCCLVRSRHRLFPYPADTRMNRQPGRGRTR